MNKMVLPNSVLLGEVERLLKDGTAVTIKTKGCSMLPFIVGGRDSVVLKYFPDYPRPGDIVLAHLHGDIYVLHRVIAISDDGKVTLMGDGNIHGREYCCVNDLCGKVVKIIRNGKEVNPYSKSFVFLSSIWSKLLPIRRIMLFIYRKLLLRNINPI